MKKTLALLLVASLLLAGCTELTDAVDEAGEEILNIEVDEDIALEKVEDFLTVDESESFGITVMYEIDMSQMDDGTGMLEVDEDAIMTMEMTEAWSPNGYHSSSVMGMNDGDMTISMITSMTHVGTTMYVSIGYEMDGELGSDASQEEQMMFDMMPEVEHFSMTTTTTHTEVIAAMAAESQESSDDMDPMAFLEMIEMIEEYGTFTPADSADGLQLFDVAIDPAAMMEGEAPSPEEALSMCDADNNQGISWDEFISEACDGDDSTEFEAAFNDADTDLSGELTVDELPAFIESLVAMSADDDEIPTPEQALEMCDTDASGGISFEEFMAEDCDDTDSEDAQILESEFNYQDADGNGELSGDELSEFIGVVSTYYEQTDSDDDMEMDAMPAMQVAFTSTGDIEYFSMEMEGTEMMMYILTEDRVNALFTDLNAGETVALPFSLSFDMYDNDWDDDWGDDGDFYCNDGTTIPMDWVNDGDEDCADGEDEMDMGGSDDEFMCDDGETIPMDWVNDGMDDCAGGEDEFDSGDDSGDEDYIFYCSNDGEAYAEGMGGILCPEGPDVIPECPNGEECVCIDVDGSCSDGDDDWGYLAVDEDDSGDYSTIYDGCTESTDPADSYYECWMNDWLDSDGNILDSDGYEMDECTELADGSGWECLRQDDSDEDEEAPTPQEFLDMTDTDSSGTMTKDELYEYMGGMEEDEDINMIFSNADQDNSNDLDIDELEVFIVDFGNYMLGGSDDDGGMDDGDDHGHEHGDNGDGGEDYSDEIVMYVTSDMDFHFEGDLSDYKIELATCESDYDMDTGEETMTCTTVMSVAIADAGEDSDIMFHDADSSGTLSVGDMIHIGETAESWDEVRLYSISADAYSDENPMHDAPGFTGLVGMLALLGAAFIRRNE